MRASTWWWTAAALLALGACSQVETAGGGGTSATGGSSAGGGGQGGHAGAGAGGQGGNGGQAASGGQGGQGGFGVPQEYIDGCQALAAVKCAGAFACIPLLWSSLYVDAAACTQTEAEICVSLHKPGMSPSNNAACAAALETYQTGHTSDEYCRAIVRSLFLGSTNPDALPECVPKGELVDGSACALGAQCQSGFCAFPTDDTKCGTCAQPLGLNDPCTQTCGAGLYCQEHVCIKWGEAGEACDPDAPTCVVDLWCDASHQCTERLPEGSPCTFPWGCPLEAECNRNGICQGYGPPRAVGQPCGFFEDGTVVFCLAASCPLPGAAWEGTCTEFEPAGELCNPSYNFPLGQDCEPELVCVGATCVSWPELFACE